MTHKHAEFLIAIATGKSPNDWECDYSGRNDWRDAANFLTGIVENPHNWQVRRKQPTRVVNGFTVPAPLRVAPAYGDSYFVSAFSAEQFCSLACWVNDSIDKRWLERGLIHLTEDAAIANAKAMCGIDPTE